MAAVKNFLMKVCALSSSRTYDILALMDFENAQVVFDNGRFDGWCVYVIDGQTRFAPTDSWYFQILKDFTQYRAPSDIYQDFIGIYELTDETIREEVLLLIHTISAQYADTAKAATIFKVLYYGMIAEENKKSPLGERLPLRKRIKRLGVYQVLLENLSPEQAANYSRGWGADYLDKVCYYRGF